MVEYTINIDSVFASLADATRRDIIKRVLEKPRSVGELASAHKRLTFAAIAKHINVLEKACLVIKEKEGRHQIISANPKAIDAASSVLLQLQEAWDARLNTLEKLLEE